MQDLEDWLKFKVLHGWGIEGAMRDLEDWLKPSLKESAIETSLCDPL